MKFEENIGLGARADVRSQVGLKKEKDLALIKAEVDKVEERSVEDAVRALERRPQVQYAEPNFKYYPAGYADEPRFSELWGLDNSGQNSGTQDVDINGLETSGLMQGDPNLVVAVIDEGVDFSHPDLTERAWTNPGEVPNNNLDDDGNGYKDDVNGWDFYYGDKTVHDPGEDRHGTHVSGTIAASVNGQGVVGVAPNVKIMSVKFLGPNGGWIDDAILAIQYAKAEGAKISNNSWGGGGASQALYDAINNSGSLFGAAAGNWGGNNDICYPLYPASYDLPNILSVAAVNNQGNLADFSNYGATSVDISAPGVSILSSVPPATWESLSGTSMATPHATGAAALVASVEPALLDNPVGLKNRIMDTGKPLPSTVGKTVTGDMVDALKAVDPSADTTPPPPPSDTAPPDTSITSGPSGTLSSTTASFSFSSSESNATFECRLDNGAFESCTSAKEYNGLSEGSHTFEVKATDTAGNTDASPASRTWTVDTTAPDTSTSGPNGPANNTAPAFTFSGSDNVTTTANLKYQYQLDSGGWSTASTSTTANLTGLSDGAHLFEVRAVDEAGNEDASPAKQSFRVDATSPKVIRTDPTAGATGVVRYTDVWATLFSEALDPTTVTKYTFILGKGKLSSSQLTSTTRIASQTSVSYNPDALMAKLDPYGTTTTRLARCQWYTAKVTTEVKDLAGNQLDQDGTLSGLQPKLWYFKTSGC